MSIAGPQGPPSVMICGLRSRPHVSCMGIHMVEARVDGFKTLRTICIKMSGILLSRQHFSLIINTFTLLTLTTNTTTHFL